MSFKEMIGNSIKSRKKEMEELAKMIKENKRAFREEAEMEKEKGKMVSEGKSMGVKDKNFGRKNAENRRGIRKMGGRKGSGEYNERSRRERK